MIVRLKFGRDNGELRDIAPEAALAMLKDGRAKNPFLDEVVQPMAAEEVDKPVAKPKGKAHR